MTAKVFANAAHARGPFVSHTNFTSHSTQIGQNEQYTSRPVYKRARTTPNELLREMQGLQIRTPANVGSHKITTESSKNGLEDQEMLTPPSTPAKAKLDEQFPSRRSLDASRSRIQEVNFTPDLSQAQLLGEGVWSKVYSSPALPSRQAESGRPLTPPSTPHKTTFGPSEQYAIKTATRSDATAVFQAEAQILTHIQTYESSSDFVVPFLGLCTGTPTPSLLFPPARLT